MARDLANNGGRACSFHRKKTKELKDEKKFKISGSGICLGDTCDGG